MSEQQKKPKYRQIGGVVKSRVKDGKTIPVHIYISEDVFLKKGDYINLETKEEKLAHLDRMEAEQRLDGKVLESLRRSANGIPAHYKYVLVKKEV